MPRKVKQKREKSKEKKKPEHIMDVSPDPDKKEALDDGDKGIMDKLRMELKNKLKMGWIANRYSW